VFINCPTFHILTVGKHRINLKKFIYILPILFLLTSCFLDSQPKTRNVTKDFNLGWYFDSRDQTLFRNTDTTQYGGSMVIPETVYAVGYNDNFIIAKRHPNKQDSIGDRLFRYDKNHTQRTLFGYQRTIVFIKKMSNGIILVMDGIHQIVCIHTEMKLFTTLLILGIMIQKNGTIKNVFLSLQKNLILLIKRKNLKFQIL